MDGDRDLGADSGAGDTDGGGEVAVQRVLVSVRRPEGGVVTSAPPGILCGEDQMFCEAVLHAPQGVILWADPAESHLFLRWEGDCASATSREIDARGAGRLYLPPTFEVLRCGAHFQHALQPVPPSSTPEGLITETSFEEGVLLEPMSSYSIQLYPENLSYRWFMGPAGDARPLQFEGARLEGFVAVGTLRLHVEAYRDEMLFGRASFVVSTETSPLPPALIEQSALSVLQGAPVLFEAKALDLKDIEGGPKGIHEVYALDEIEWVVIKDGLFETPLLRVSGAPNVEGASFSHAFDRSGIFWVHLLARTTQGDLLVGSASITVM